jgi:spermidine synthase
VSGLIYEVIWARQLTLVFGATAPAVTTVLTSFMLGMSLGSYVAGRWAWRRIQPLRAYALIELGVGVYAVAFPLLLDGLNMVHVPLFRRLIGHPLLLGEIRVVMVVALLLVPTMLMGASLPVLARALTQGPARVEHETGLLYGLNTLGAAAGVYVSTFFLIPRVGLTGGWLVAAALNCVVAGMAWHCARRWPAPPSAEPVAAPSAGARPVWILLAYGGSGLAALGYEVVWTRISVLLFGSSVYAMAVVLASFLLGLGAGSLVGSRLAERARRPFVVAAALQIVIAVGVLVGAPWFDRLPELFLEAFRLSGGQWWSLTALEFLIALGLMIVPTLAMGATFPLVTRLLGAGGDAGRVVGTAYTANTWGAIVGAALTGFWLIPWLGFRGSLLALAGINVLAACVLLAREPGRRGWQRWAVVVPAVAGVVTLALLPGWNVKALSSGAYLYPQQYLGYGFDRLIDQQRVIFYREGATATVAVMEAKYRFLRINGKTDAGDSPDNLTERLLAHVPLLLHPEPRSVLVIGLGTGVTLGSALLHPIERADAVEISQEVVDASQFFTEANLQALDDRRTRLHVLDARTWLMAMETRYDVITSEPSNPWQTGNANLFTLEHYRLVQARLAPNGIFCQWLPFYRMDEGDFRAAIRTFQAVFPNTTVWFSGGDVLLVGSVAPIVVNPARFLQRASQDGVTRSLREIGIGDGASLLGFFMLDPPSVRAYVGGGPPYHSDNYPLLEFSGPKTLYRESAPEILTKLRQLTAKSLLPLEPAAGPGLADVYGAIGNERLVLHMPDAALAALELAVKNGDASPRIRQLEGYAWNDIAVALGRQGAVERAAEAFGWALAFAPDAPEVHLNLGLFALYRLGDLDRAERHLRVALQSRPNDREALIGLARVFERSGRRDQARAAWRAVLLIDPTNSDAAQALRTAETEQ